MIELKQLSASQADFWSSLEEILAWEGVSDDKVTDIVKEILAEVKSRGDEAVLEYSRRFDHVTAEKMSDLEISLERAKAALENIPAEQRQALEAAAQRVRQYHDHQKQSSWSYTEEDGTLLGQQVTPLDRAGLYVPGGKAAYPSSVLMNAIP
ncbi:MAG: histidinol dehydrogenase, partial [Pseudomonadota bacterium]|nr:histidinol dehydrogenase [Pseudomonadota bacterium]